MCDGLLFQLFELHR